jgi:hypothetical protein
MFDIYSPSYKRSDGIRTHRLLPDIQYCVAESEGDAYRAQGVNVITMPDKVQGNIARVRNWILDHARKQGKPFAIIDDDIRYVKQWTKHNKTGNLDGDRLIEFIESSFNLASEWGVRLWGLHFNQDKGNYRESCPFSTLSFLTASFHGFVDCNFPLRYDEEIPLKEDYDMTLQELSAWRKVLRFNFVHLIKDDHKNKGGCADMRSVRIEKDQLMKFQLKWGSDIVRVDNGSNRKATRKKQIGYDINPMIRVPIKGV